ncbi:hypothetical protein Efla_003406 [Eimeria flavescens]
MKRQGWTALHRGGHTFSRGLSLLAPGFAFRRMWKDLWLVLVVVAFEMRDTKAFNCLLREEKAAKAPPSFAPVENSPPAYVARGSLACVEDVVAFANAKRAGPDGVIGTEDDTLTIEEHLDLLGASLEANFWGGSAVLTQVMVADVDEMLLLRVVPPGATLLINSGSTERHIFPLEGGLVLSRTAPLRKVYLHATPTHSKMTASSPVDLTAFRVKPGKRILLGAPEARGAVYLEHITTHVPRAAFTVFAYSALFHGWDLGSAMTAVGALYKSLQRNVVQPLTQLLWDGEDSLTAQGAANVNSERSRRKAEQQALADSAETREEEAFNEARRLMQKEQRRRQLEAAANPPSQAGQGAPQKDQQQQQQQEQKQQEQKQQQQKQQQKQQHQEEEEEEEEEDEVEEEEDDDEEEEEGEGEGAAAHDEL